MWVEAVWDMSSQDEEETSRIKTTGTKDHEKSKEVKYILRLETPDDVKEPPTTS